MWTVNEDLRNSIEILLKEFKSEFNQPHELNEV